MNFGYENDSDKSEKLMLSALLVYGPISPFDRNTHFLENTHT